MLKILREKFRQPTVLSVCPQVGVVPGEPVGRHSEHSNPEHLLIRIEHGEFIQQVFRLPPRLFRAEQGAPSRPAFAYSIYEFDQRLVRKVEFVCLYPVAQQFPGLGALFLGSIGSHR